ncbi:uncharacterized protein LOC118491604 [Helianthus annuus]|uniref:uncharacterized protein LOC118491604 n=1 Tax=Helianthus annuus TaxID=4232 RepID=UPI0016533A0B|nr:uncharacterized protein LOC118491604 [Helianthus annuus]
MSNWDFGYFFGEISNESYVSDSVWLPGVDRGEEEVVSVRPQHAGTYHSHQEGSVRSVVPDLNQVVEEAGPSYVAQSYPQQEKHAYGTYHSHQEKQRKKKSEEGAFDIEEDENEIEKGVTHFEESDQDEEDGGDWDDGGGGDDGGEKDDGANDPKKQGKVFATLHELKNWAYKTEIAKGYVIVTQRTVTKGEDSSARTVKIWLQCDRGGTCKSKATVRRSGSKKIGCPFKMIGKLDASSGNWSLVVKQKDHNHEHAVFLEGHAFARRLTPDEELLVERLYIQNMEPTNIHLTIRKQNPQSVCILRDIQNVIKRLKSKCTVIGLQCRYWSKCCMKEGMFTTPG